MTSTRSLHPLHDEVLDFHSFVIAWLGKTTVSKAHRTRVKGASLNAAVALELAVTGESLDANLRKARVSMKSAGAVLRVLAVEGHFAEQHYADARKRIDAILAGLERLGALPFEAWHLKPAPSRDPGPAGAAQAAARSAPSPQSVGGTPTESEDQVFEDYIEVDAGDWPPEN